MRRIVLLLLTGFVLFGTAGAQAQNVLDKARRDEVVSVPEGDADMAEAFRKARATLPEFFALAQNPKPSMSGFSIKVGVPADSGNHEFFWIRPFERNGDQFSGQLRNTPRDVKALKIGDTIQFKEAEIVDWTYRDNGKMKGNFTACALLKRDTKANAEAFMKQYGFDCDI